MRFIPFKNIHAGAFFVIKCPYMHKFNVLQNFKIPTSVDFHIIYQICTHKYTVMV